jgi:hypothetical protein
MNATTRFKVVLAILIGFTLFISGCGLPSGETSLKDMDSLVSDVQPADIFNAVSCSSCTSAQKTQLVNKFIGKKIRWTEHVSDVYEDGSTLVVANEITFVLLGIPSSETISLMVGDAITFEGNLSSPTNNGFLWEVQNTRIVSSTEISDSQSTVPIAPTDGLESFIVGLWEYKIEDASDSTGYYLDFTSNGTLIEDGRKISKYAIVSESAILVTTDSDGEGVIGVSDFHENSIKMGWGQERIEYHRVEGESDIDEAIIGLWAFKDEDSSFGVFIEFAPNNKVVLGDDEVGQYRVLSSNSIELYNLPDSSNFPDIIQVTGAINNTLTLYRFIRGEPYTFARIEEHQNLSKRIIGLWRDEHDYELEFFADGRALKNNTLVNYDVISNNTIVIQYPGEDEYSVLNIVNLTDDTLSMGDFGLSYLGDGIGNRTYTRVQP